MNDKDLYTEKLHAQMNEWKVEIDSLKAKLNTAKVDVKADIAKAIDELEDKVQVVKDKSIELSKATEESWDALKVNVEVAWKSIKDSLHDVASKFK
jgi:hypothetical protein